MEKFIGTKLVEAEPATRVQRMGREPEIIPEGRDMPFYGEKGTTYRRGYRVRYQDGYESWSPEEAFEKAYRRTDSMSFGLALEAARMGKKIARAGWNGKDQYVELGHNFGYNTSDGESSCAFHRDIGSQALVFVGTRGRQVGWLASQADMLADDWHIVE